VSEKPRFFAALRMTITGFFDFFNNLLEASARRIALGSLVTAVCCTSTTHTRRCKRGRAYPGWRMVRCVKCITNKRNRHSTRNSPSASQRLRPTCGQFIDTMNFLSANRPYRGHTACMAMPTPVHLCRTHGSIVRCKCGTWAVPCCANITQVTCGAQCWRCNVNRASQGRCSTVGSYRSG
jgi:hypothetical protein